MRRPFFPLLLLLLGLDCLWRPSLVGAQTGTHGHTPGQVEASFLANLFKFVRWPQSPALTTATVCFFGPSTVQSRLQLGVSEHLRWAQLPDRSIVIRLLSTPDEIEGSQTTPPCQVVYLDARSADRLWPFSTPKGVLTVSDQKAFANHGGMFQFIWDGSDTYRIAANPGTILESGLIVSGALATLTDRVDDARFAPP